MIGAGASAIATAAASTSPAKASQAQTGRGFGQQLTLAEGTAKDAYKTVTLTIPPNARVRENGQKSTLSNAQDGQQLIVITGPGSTLVVARTPRSGA